MISALLLLGIVGAYVLLGLLSEENIKNMRDAAIEAKQWIRLQLDNNGQRPDLDGGSNIEAGVYRGQASGVAPTLASTSFQSDYASLVQQSYLDAGSDIEAG